MRFSVDSNILFYAVDRQNAAHRAVAQDIISRGRHLDMILTSQVLGEFLNAVRRKNSDFFEQAIELVAQWSLLFPVAWTSPDHIAAGGRLARRYKLQFWDSVIIEVARAERAAMFLTEDMQDGSTIDGVTLLNPFKQENTAALASILGR